MSVVKDKILSTTKESENLKNLKPFERKSATTKNHSPTLPKEQAQVSSQAKALNETDPTKPEPNTNATEAIDKASSVAEKLAKVPVLPVVVPKTSDNKIIKKMEDKPVERFHYIKKPAVIFIEGFSAFGISNGDGIKDMAENYPGAKLFSWDQKPEIINEVKKHSLDQPVVLVGHSFGGDTAVEVANELNSAKNSFRNIDMLISLDSVGFKNNIMPINVKRNLNFFQEGVIPFLHGSPNIARNTDHTEVVNELRSELHSKIEDSEDVQFKIFETLNEITGATNRATPEIVIQLDLDDLIDSQLSFLKTE